MNLTKTKRGYSARVAGRSIRLGTDNIDEAKRLVKSARLEDVDHLHRAAMLTASTVQRLTYGKRVTCEMAMTAFTDHLTRTNIAPLTQHRYAQTVGKFLSTRMTAPVNTLTERHVDEFVNPKSSIRAGSRNNRRSALLAFFRFCSAKGFVLGNPAELIEVRLHDLSHSQMEPTQAKPVFSVDTPLEGFWRVAVLLGTELGLRLSDVAQLEWASVLGDRLVIYTDKTRTRLELAISPELQSALVEVPKLDPELVFPEEWSIMQSPTRRALLSTQFKRLTGVGFHQLRAGFATRLALQGESISGIQRRMGHSSPEMTQRYIRKL